MGDRNQGEFRLKLDIPIFDGYLHIEDYLDWEQTVKAFFWLYGGDAGKASEISSLQTKRGSRRMVATTGED